MGGRYSEEEIFFEELLSVAGESIDELESRKFKEGLDSKINLSTYSTFCKAVEFKMCLHGGCDAKSRLTFSWA